MCVPYPCCLSHHARPCNHKQYLVWLILQVYAWRAGGKDWAVKSDAVAYKYR
jgi:hypothetical protein